MVLSRKWIILAGMGAGTFMTGLELFVIGMILPQLVEDLETNLATAEWIALGYSLMLNTMALTVGKLGDLYKKNWLYVGGLSLFTIGSLACGLASSMTLLIAFRMLQGLGAVFILGLETAIITEVFPLHERGRAHGINNSMLVLGIATGPGIGGLLMSLGGWRLTFLINVPLGIIITLIVALALRGYTSKDIPQKPFQQINEEDKNKFDILGALLVTATLTSFAMALTRIQIYSLGEPIQILLFILSVLGLLSFLMVESRVEKPIVDLSLFSIKEFSSNLLLSLMMFGMIAGVELILPIFLELCTQFPLQEIGLMLTALALFSAVPAPFAGIISDRFGNRVVNLVGILIIAVGCMSAIGLSKDSSMLDFLIRTVPIEIGLGIFIAPNINLIMNSVPENQLGIASGLRSLSRTLGMTTGVALIGAIFTLSTLSGVGIGETLDVTQAPVSDLVHGVKITFTFMTAIALISIAISLVTPNQQESSAIVPIRKIEKA
ncbi:MAG: MFS transporter [Cyanobacteria bacterium J06635_10]